MYAIAELNLSEVGTEPQRRVEFVKKLGYRNLSKGLRRLDDLIRYGVCPRAMQAQLPEALGMDSGKVQVAWEKTRRQMEEEEARAAEELEERARRNFRPHIWIKHELSRPKSITGVAFFGLNRWKVIPLPDDIEKRPSEDQEQTVRDAIRQRKNLHRNESMFGQITGYVYCPNFDKGILYSIEGEVLDPDHGPISRPQVSMEIK